MCTFIFCNKRSFYFCFFLLLVFSIAHTFANDKTDELENKEKFVNDICLPSKLYMLSEIQNDIFVEPLIKRWRPYNDVVRFDGPAKYSRRLQRVASIINPADGDTIELKLFNQDYFEEIKSIKSELVVGEKGKGNAQVIVSIIGDSYTEGAFFKDALLVKGYVPKIKMVGLRDIKGFDGQYDEGRGGWTLAKYFRVTKQRNEAYNGFWQPAGSYKYWGSTHFWKLANDIRLSPEANWSFREVYNGGRYSTRSYLFDEKTGFKLNPQADDIMFNNDLEHFVRYNGKEWIAVEYDDFSWGIDYGKYLSMWNLEAPEMLFEFLGLNDFRDGADPSKIDFTQWNQRIEKLAASYLEAVPGGKFVLMIPSSTCGILDNKSGYFTTRQNACMWEHRKNIIEKFDHREEESIYLVDAAIAIDNVSGYKFLNDSVYTKPYSEYTGSDFIRVQTGNPHPYGNYSTMGISLAAFIQKYRK